MGRFIFKNSQEYWHQAHESLMNQCWAARLLCSAVLILTFSNSPVPWQNVLRFTRADWKCTQLSICLHDRLSGCFNLIRSPQYFCGEYLWGLEVSKRWSTESDSRRDLYSLNSNVGRSHPKKNEANSEKRCLCVSLLLTFLSFQVTNMPTESQE